MSQEQALPTRRSCTTQSVKIAGQRLYCSVGFYEDGRIGEIFLSIAKTGGQERALLDEIARSASKRLQRGEPVEELAESWMGTKLSPYGIVEGDPDIRLCSGPLDWVGRWLLVNFCGRTELSVASVRAVD